jgi:hypothetical protein
MLKAWSPVVVQQEGDWITLALTSSVDESIDGFVI